MFSNFSNHYRLMCSVGEKTIEVSSGTREELLNHLFAIRSRRIQAWMERVYSV